MTSKKHTPGEWIWLFEDRSGPRLCTTDRGLLTVMDFVRHGMNRAQPRFSIWDGEERGRRGGMMRTATEIGDLGQHPDAKLIAAAPALFSALEIVEAFLARQAQTIDVAGVLGEVQAAIAKAVVQVGRLTDTGGVV